MRILPVRLLAKAGGNVVDQAMSALSNVVLSIVIARSLDASGFGAFSIALVIFGISVAVTKSLVGQPLQIRFSAGQPEVIKAATSRALGLALLISLAAAVICLIAGMVLPGVTGQALLALSVILPALLLQDSCRMAFFAFGRPWYAALVDAVWGVLQLGFLAILLTLGLNSVGWLILAWGAGAAASAILAFALLRTRPRISQGLEWLREQKGLSRYLLAEYVLGLGAMQVGILLVGVIATVSAVGSLRAAQVLLGPLAIVGVAAFQFAVPEIARRPDLSARKLTIFGFGLSGVLGTITVSYVVLLLLIPDKIGVQLFGDSWAGAALVLLPMGLSSLASSLANGPAGVLYGMGKARDTFRINLAKGPVLIVSLLTCTWLWDAVGAAWALALTEAAVLPAWIWTFRRAVRGSANPAGTVADRSAIATLEV